MVLGFWCFGFGNHNAATTCWVHCYGWQARGNNNSNTAAQKMHQTAN
jgi:hypothetical protein